MLRLPLAIVVFLTPSLVLADPETLDAELRDLALAAPAELGFHAKVFAQLAGGTSGSTSEGGFAMGGELRYGAPQCDAIRIGGQARLGYRNGTAASFEQWASACVPALVMEIGHHLEWDVRASLLAPLQLRTGTNRRETLSFHWTPLRLPLPRLLEGVAAGEAAKQGQAHVPWTDEERDAIPKGDGIVFDVRLDATVLWGPNQPTSFRQEVETIPFGYLRRHRAAWGDARDFAVDLFAAGGEFVDEGASVRVWLARLRNLQLGPLYVTAGGGIISGAVGPFRDVPGEMYPSREVNITRPRGLLALETGGTRVRGHVRATHDLTIVPDGYLTVDARLAGGLTTTLPLMRVGLEATLASTQIHVPFEMPRTATTGGGALSFVRTLAPNLDASLQLDVGRSFYASRADATDFTPRWGFAAFAALQTSLSN